MSNAAHVVFAGMSLLAIFGALCVGFGLLITTMNLVSVVHNHTTKRAHWSHVFFVPTVFYVSAALALGTLYQGWEFIAVLLALIVLSEGLPILLANALVGWVRRRGERLEGAELPGANLQGRNLRGAFLAGATLDRAVLASADLRETQIHRVWGFQNARYGALTKWPAEMEPAAIPRRGN